AGRLGLVLQSERHPGPLRRPAASGGQPVPAIAGECTGRSRAAFVSRGGGGRVSVRRAAIPACGTVAAGKHSATMGLTRRRFLSASASVTALSAASGPAALAGIPAPDAEEDFIHPAPDISWEK